jgi:hypothetical protein
VVCKNVEWKEVAQPKYEGGWGMKNIHLFGKALTPKRLWRVTTKKILWKWINV